MGYDYKITNNIGTLFDNMADKIIHWWGEWWY